MKFKIFYGLGGGFGGANNEEIIECDSLGQAEQEAYSACCEYYESYVGMYGLRGIDEIKEEDGVEDDEAWDIFNDERESWLDYRAEEIKE